MSLMPCAVGLPFPATISLIALAQFGRRLSGPKRTANLGLDQLLKKNHQLLRKKRYLLGEIAFVRNNLVNSHISVREVQTLDYLREKNQQFEKKNQQMLGDVAAVRNKPVRPDEVRTRVKAENITAKIATWLADASGSA